MAADFDIAAGFDIAVDFGTIVVVRLQMMDDWSNQLEVVEDIAVAEVFLGKNSAASHSCTELVEVVAVEVYTVVVEEEHSTYTGHHSKFA